MQISSGECRRWTCVDAKSRAEDHADVVDVRGKTTQRRRGNGNSAQRRRSVARRTQKEKKVERDRSATRG